MREAIDMEARGCGGSKKYVECCSMPLCYPDGGDLWHCHSVITNVEISYVDIGPSVRKGTYVGRLQ